MFLPVVSTLRHIIANNPVLLQTRETDFGRPSLPRHYLITVHFFLTDTIFQARCLVDTSTACSIWPMKLLTEKPPVSSISLQAVNHSPIPMYGQISRSLDLELRRDFTWILMIADLPYPILGSGFLHHYNLLVDMRGRRLIDTNTELSVPDLKSTVSSLCPVFFIAASDDPFQALLSSFLELTNQNFVVSKPTHSIKHHIETTGPPVFSQFNYLLQLEIIRPSSSQWGSFLHLVKKRSGNWRPTGDFRRQDGTRSLPHPTHSGFRFIAERL